MSIFIQTIEHGRRPLHGRVSTCWQRAADERGGVRSAETPASCGYSKAARRLRAKTQRHQSCLLASAHSYGMGEEAREVCGCLRATQGSSARNETLESTERVSQRL